MGIVKIIKSVVRSTIPGSQEAYTNAREAARRFKYGNRYMEGVFSEIYSNNLWGDNESVSGPGSSLAQTAVIRHEMPLLLKKINAESMLDAPCGDYNWMKYTELDLDRYIGADIVPELIDNNRKLYEEKNKKFILLDVTKDEIPEVDIILCRDCFIHFSFKFIFSTIKNFKKSRSKYLLTTTFSGLQKNMDIVTGGWRPVDLQLPPFNLPEPNQIIVEKDFFEGNSLWLSRRLGLWKLGDL